MVRTGLAVVLAMAIGCGYSPNPESRKLICGRGSSCPEDYTCVANTCWNQADANLVGRWVFGPSSTESVACDDGFTETTNLQGPEGFFDVQGSSATSPLLSEFYCVWRLGISGTTTVLQPGQSCSRTRPEDGAVFTWSGQLFTFSTNDGRTGRLTASLPYTFAATAGSGTCTLQISGNLTKN